MQMYILTCKFYDYFGVACDSYRRESRAEAVYATSRTVTPVALS